MESISLCNQYRENFSVANSVKVCLKINLTKITKYSEITILFSNFNTEGECCVENAPCNNFYVP